MTDLVKCAPRTIIVGGGHAQAVRIGADGVVHGAESSEWDGTTLRILCTQGGDSSMTTSTFNFGTNFGQIGSQYSSVGGNVCNISNGVVTINGVRVWVRNGTVHVKAPAAQRVVVNGQAVQGNSETPAEPAPRVTHCIDPSAVHCVKKLVVESGAELCLDGASAPPWLAADKLSVSLNSAGKLVVRAPITVQRLGVSMSGASSLAGNRNLTAAQKIKIDISGASSLSAVLAPRGGSVDASGASAVSVLSYAREAVRRRVSGMARVNVQLIEEEAPQRPLSPTSTRAKRRRGEATL